MNIYLEVRLNPLVIPPFDVNVEGLGDLPQSVFATTAAGVYTYSSALPRPVNPILVTLNISGIGGTVQPPCAVCLVSFTKPPTDADFVKPPLIAKIPAGQQKDSDSAEYPTDGSIFPPLLKGVV
jgi:hypothetical protein